MAPGNTLRRGLTAGLVFGLVLISGCASDGSDYDRGESATSTSSFRVYRLNNKNQQIRNRWSRNAAEAGCQDLRGTKKAYRIAQVGFAWCTIYAGDACAAGTELGAWWRGSDYLRADFDPEQPQIKLLPGANWYLSEDENVQVGSWRCEYE